MTEMRGAEPVENLLRGGVKRSGRELPCSRITPLAISADRNVRSSSSRLGEKERGAHFAERRNFGEWASCGDCEVRVQAGARTPDARGTDPA